MFDIMHAKNKNDNGVGWTSREHRIPYHIICRLCGKIETNFIWDDVCNTHSTRHYTLNFSIVTNLKLEWLSLKSCLEIVRLKIFRNFNWESGSQTRHGWVGNHNAIKTPSANEIENYAFNRCSIYAKITLKR